MSEDQASAQPDEQEQPEEQRDGEHQHDAAIAVERTVSHALFDYSDPVTGSPRTGLFGQRIQVGPKDLARGEASGALVDGDLIVPGLAAVVPAPTPELTGGSDAAPPPSAEGGHLGPLDPGAVSAAAVVGGEDGNAPDRPYQTSTKTVWVEYVVRSAAHHGDDTMSPERAKGMTKDELMAWRPAS